MSSVPTSNSDNQDLLVVPESLKKQLTEFRSRVWTSKMLESLAFGIVAVLLSFLTVYCVDRIVDTPQQARVGIFFVALAAWLAVPYALHRWVWSQRRFEQLARLLRVRESEIGNQLLSVIELAEDKSEQERSRTLCAAAIAQVAETAKDRNLTEAAPPTRLRSLTVTLGMAAAVVVTLAVLFPSAAMNAWERFSAPWNNTPRYTFTMLQPVPESFVVPHGESATFQIALTDESRWQPEKATLKAGGLPAIESKLVDGQYVFEIPPQVSDLPMKLEVGDFYQSVLIEPKLRPELIGAKATVRLPEYLKRPEPFEMDVRSGTLAAVQGSSAVVNATASRPLQNAQINKSDVEVSKDSFGTQTISLKEEVSKLSMTWRDHDGLAGREPFQLTVKPAVDELPSVVSQDFPRQAVVLDSEQINFQALAADDFGIKTIGISWRGLDETLAEATQGEKIIAGGGPENTSMQVPATFSAKALGIDPQPIEVRLWTEDYMPDRERQYSAPHVLFVLTPEEHAIWITSQLSKWHRAALDVRDKEMQLHAANKKLREMTEEELADEEMRGELRRQASAEASNGRRLSGLAKMGEGLLRQASRNPEIGVGHLDRWAEMLEVLNDIGNERMPSVSDLLGEASQQAKLARAGQGQPGEESEPKDTAPQAGENRDARSGGPGKKQPKAEDFVNAPQMPSVSDMESSMHPNEAQPEQEEGEGPEKKGNGTKLSLPTTTITGPAGKKQGEQKEQEDQGQGEEPLDEALFEQEELLAEFEKIAEELNAILANLEGSTLVKRLKAASREQDQVAQRIGERIDSVFGRVKSMQAEDRKVLTDLGGVEEASSQKVSYIMDDMQSYFERRRMNQFKVILEEMKESEVLTALQDLGEAIPKKQGMSIAQAEFWADTFDRWADDLVDPACSGQCPGSKTSDALPPSVILEVLKILESEVNLREETRVAEQSREAVELDVHEKEAGRLSDVQDEIENRVHDVVITIEELPKGTERFGKEIQLLSKVADVMWEAKGILGDYDTGSAAIAAETEAIELLLQCKRINPKGGGGGGGTSPGGGGTGDTKDSALALLGTGLNQNERREARSIGQSTGETGRVLPEEFRAGLDKYFEQIEQGL